MRRVLFWVLIALLVVPSAGLAAAQDATPGASPAGGGSLLEAMGYPEIRVATDGTTNDFPTEVEAGRYHVVLENQSDMMEIDLEIWQLPEGVTIDDVVAFFESGDEEAMVPDFFYDMNFNGGPAAFPGETTGVVLDLTPGEWYANVYTYDPETDENTDMPVAFTVTGEMPELDEPAADATIEMVDMDFIVPDTIAAGPQTWNLVNTGEQPHHLILSRVPDGTTEEDVMQLAMMFAGPPASPEAGASPMAEPAMAPEDLQDVLYSLPISPGNFNVLEVDLEPGTYSLICFLPDPSGMPHVLMGMVEIIVVE